jgi:signal peptidase II
MRTSIAVLLAVLLADLLLKFLFNCTQPSMVVRLGPFGSLRMVAARMWLARVGWPLRPAALWILWASTAAMLSVVSTWLPSSPVFVGLVLGGSLSNTLESSWRGCVSDYICLKFWPAFNLADLALTAGAIGVVIELLAVVTGTLT